MWTWFNFWSEKSCAVKDRQKYIKGYLREAQSEYNSILIFVIAQLYLYIPTIFMILTKWNDISTFVFLWFDLHLSLNNIHATVNLSFDNIWCHAQNSCGTSCIRCKNKKALLLFSSPVRICTLKTNFVQSTFNELWFSVYILLTLYLLHFYLDAHIKNDFDLSNMH